MEIIDTGKDNGQTYTGDKNKILKSYMTGTVCSVGNAG